MDVSFRQFLEQSLEENEKHTRKIDESSVITIQEALSMPEFGICLGCRGELKKLSMPKIVVVHVGESGQAYHEVKVNCTYMDEYGMVPEWAFFPHELFEE